MALAPKTIEMKTYKKLYQNLCSYENLLSAYLKARKGKIIAIADEGDENIKTKVDHVIYVPEVIDELKPIVNIIPLQLLAYYIADLKGCNVDQPKNLAKVVSVE